jgi:hypothetical protein
MGLKSKTKTDSLVSGLRNKAEKMLADLGQNKLTAGDSDIQALFQELQVHQIAKNSK